MTTAARLFARASLFGVLTACAAGSDPTTAPPPAPPHSTSHASTPDLTTVKGFCAARAKDECSAAVVSACGLTGQDSCVEARSKSCLAGVPQGTKYQAEKAPRCLAAVKAVYATAKITARGLASLDPVCATDLFAGPGADRAPCLTDYDCNSSKGLECVMPNPPSSATMGQCFVAQILPPGGDCSVQGSVCAKGNYCDPTGLTCTTDNQVGDTCNAPDYPCAPGLVCNGLAGFGANCGAMPADGSPCENSSECASNLCDKATGQASGTCASEVTLTSLDSMCAVFE